jgi:hypothetical protein
MKKAIERLENIDLPSDEELLKSLQYLALLKIAKYESKWSKSSEDHIERLNKDFNDLDKLIKYFTKR